MRGQTMDAQSTHPWDDYQAGERPEDLWNAMARVLPPEPAKPRGGRARTVDPRPTLEGIFDVPRTGCPWQACPRVFGAPSTV